MRKIVFWFLIGLLAGYSICYSTVVHAQTDQDVMKELDSLDDSTTAPITDGDDLQIISDPPPSPKSVKKAPKSHPHSVKKLPFCTKDNFVSRAEVVMKQEHWEKECEPRSTPCFCMPNK